VKILVGVDGSEQSLAALETLCRHLHWFRDNAELTLLYVHPALPYQRAVSWAGKEAVHAYYDEESETALATARTALGQRNIAYKEEKRVGDAAEQIMDCATSGGFDLIAMGTHGRTALANLVLGSVATKVLAGSRIPVLLLH
jgi:nucleotide-binding universal stress UspA family protein